jgi:hypothetical protein
MGAVSDRYVVVLGDDKKRGFGDELSDAIGYAADATSVGIAAEVWATRPESAWERVWPDFELGAN